MAGAEVFDRLEQAAIEQMAGLVAPDPEPVAILFLDVPEAGHAAIEGSSQRRAIAAFGGRQILADGTATLAWLPDAAHGIAVWVELGRDHDAVYGGLTEGPLHSHDLLRTATREAAALARSAGPGALMIAFELTNVVDLRDPRFSAERTEKGALVPWSCRLTLRGRSGATIRDLEAADAEPCDEIVRGLPEWFGLEDGIRQCAEAVRAQPGLVAEDDGSVVAFVTWQTDLDEAEITWMAVHADRRRQGHGRALIASLSERLQARGVRKLLVKTLSSRAEYEPYAQTRSFYLAMGFTAERELDIWDEDNPAVLLVKRL